MKRILFTLAAVAFLLLPAAAGAQTMHTDLWSAQDLKQYAAVLQQEAKDKGSAAKLLEKFPHHYTMISFRNQTGKSEWHRDYDDIFVIVDGGCTLLTGGEIEGGETTGEGEIRGTAIKGGGEKSQELKTGDVIHIPAKLSHQMVLPAGSTVTYFVIKVEVTR